MSEDRMKVATVDKADGTVCVWSPVMPTRGVVGGVRTLLLTLRFPNYGAGRLWAEEFEAKERAAAEARAGRRS